jgi:hypothetical protein
MRKMPQRVMAIARGVLTHWRDTNSVLQLEATKLERLEEFGNGFLIFGMDDGCTGGYLLLRSVKGYLLIISVCVS